ncbi:uncharacterized protein [Miscanthus floridulus]|uniref:uncharacterized protein n=1 Tax=Miscanthus floridulus TaxID=154761 RepID=UPI0034581D37
MDSTIASFAPKFNRKPLTGISEMITMANQYADVEEAEMDPSDSREMMCKQAAAMVVVMVFFVTTRLKRKKSEPESEPNPLLDRSLVSEREGCTVEEQVAMFLYVVGHNQRFRVAHQSFRRSIETVHKVLYAIGELRNEMIKPPSTAIHPKECIGAIDGTHVLEDSAHDALILADAIERGDGFTVPLAGVVVAGAGASDAAATAGAGAAIVGAADHAAAEGARAMRWNNNTSGFVLRRMAQLVSDGSRPNKVLKDKDVNYVAKALKEFNGAAVSPTQVYNHPRKWRQKWARICKLKDLSGALWDSDVNAIMLEGEHYLGHYKMESIFGHGMATGRFAQGSSEALGVNHADSVAAKAKDVSFPHVPTVKTQTEAKEGSKVTKLLSSVVGGKMKRGNFSEDEMLMLTNTSDVVNNVTNALRETGPTHVDANLYLAVMEMPSFTEEALIVANTYLLDNKAQGRGFVGMSDSHRDIWLRNDLAKNYYM